MFQLNFEITMIHKIKNEYLDTQIHGCFFHHTQVLFTKVVDVDLRNDYVLFGGDPLIKTLVLTFSSTFSSQRITG